MEKRTLPVQQLTILVLCRLAEPISLTSVFPYLPEMIESLGVEKNNVAAWAGMAASLYSTSQCITAIPWSMLSDRWGRRPVILLSLTITMLTSLLWGFSTTLPMALTARLLSGAGNGVAGIIRTMVAEMCPWKELQPVAFSIMPVVYNVGSIIGPAFGGALSNTLERVPGTPPRSNNILEKFPYALPNIVAACLFLAGIVIGGLYLHETLPGHKDDKDIGLVIGEKMTSRVHKIVRGIKNRVLGGSEPETEPLLVSQANTSSGATIWIGDSRKVPTATVASEEEPKPAAGWRDVLSTQSSLNLLVYGLICMHSTSYDQLLPVYMHYPARDPTSSITLPFKFNNGFGINSGRIGALFTLYGIASMVFQLIFFPILARHFGLLHCLKACSVIFPITYFISPFASLLPTSLSQQAALLAIWLIKGLCVTIAFPSSVILLTNSVSDSRYLATLNGFATTISAVGRAVGPSIIGPMFTLGVDWGYIVVPFWTLAVITALSAIPVFYLIDPDGKQTATGSEADDE